MASDFTACGKMMATFLLAQRAHPAPACYRWLMFDGRISHVVCAKAACAKRFRLPFELMIYAWTVEAPDRLAWNHVFGCGTKIFHYPVNPALFMASTHRVKGGLTVKCRSCNDSLELAFDLQ